MSRANSLNNAKQKRDCWKAAPFASDPVPGKGPKSYRCCKANRFFLESKLRALIGLALVLRRSVVRNGLAVYAERLIEADLLLVADEGNAFRRFTALVLFFIKKVEAEVDGFVICRVKRGDAFFIILRR